MAKRTYQILGAVCAWWMFHPVIKGFSSITFLGTSNSSISPIMSKTSAEAKQNIHSNTHSRTQVMIAKWRHSKLVNGRFLVQNPPNNCWSFVYQLFGLARRINTIQTLHVYNTVRPIAIEQTADQMKYTHLWKWPAFYFLPSPRLVPSSAGTGQTSDQ